VDPFVPTIKMRSFYFILILIIAGFMFIGLYYVRMEMSNPEHLGRIERAERDLDARSRDERRVIVVPPGNVITIQQQPAPAPAPEPEPAREQPKVDMTYRLIDRIYKEPTQVKAPNLDFFNKEIYTTIPGSLHLKFQGVSTEKEYPLIEVKVSMVDAFIVGGVYTREQINAAKK
jgi:hypothetical protein